MITLLNNYSVERHFFVQFNSLHIAGKLHVKRQCRRQIYMHDVTRQVRSSAYDRTLHDLAHPMYAYQRQPHRIFRPHCVETTDIQLHCCSRLLYTQSPIIDYSPITIQVLTTTLDYDLNTQLGNTPLSEALR